MATWFGITTPVTDQTLPGDTRSGQQLYTVTNESGRLIQGNATIIPEGETKVDWFTIANASRTYSADATEQVPATIKVPADVAAGIYSYRLRVVVGGGVPEEQFNDGPSSRITVLPTAVPPPPKPFPWWIVAVAAVVIVLIVGGLIWALRPTPPSTPTPTPTLAPTVAPTQPPTQPPAPKLIVDTPILMVPDAFLDTDSGSIAADGADLWFQQVSDSERYLVPQQDAVVATQGQDSPGAEGCAKATLGGDRILLDNLQPGTYLCLRTANGNISEMRFAGLSDVLELRLRKWQP